MCRISFIPVIFAVAFNRKNSTSSLTGSTNSASAKTRVSGSTGTAAVGKYSKKVFDLRVVLISVIEPNHSVYCYMKHDLRCSVSVTLVQM